MINCSKLLKQNNDNNSNFVNFVPQETAERMTPHHHSDPIVINSGAIIHHENNISEVAKTNANHFKTRNIS